MSNKIQKNNLFSWSLLCLSQSFSLHKSEKESTRIYAETTFKKFCGENTCSLSFAIVPVFYKIVTFALGIYGRAERRAKYEHVISPAPGGTSLEIGEIGCSDSCHGDCDLVLPGLDHAEHLHFQS